MRYYIIAGEASGDLHGSNLIKALKQKDTQAEVRAWGGDLMQAAGAEVVKHYRDLAFMGFVEVVANLRTILGNLKRCKQDVKSFAPDALILIDYPGFNMRIAEWAKAEGIKVIYYVSPQVWAWKQKRALKLKRTVDRMLCILPFEPDFYKKFDWEVDYVGHPLLDAIANRPQFSASERLNSLGLSADKPVLALLPGSRAQEIQTKLPIMLQAAAQFPEMQAVIAMAPSQTEGFYQQFIGDAEVKLVNNRTYDLLEVTHAAMVTSGTATLETALFNVPEVVCYKGNPLSYLIARQLIKVNYISLVNLIAGKELVKELIQNEMTAKHIGVALKKLLNTDARAQLINEYKALEAKLKGGSASARAAEIIWEEVQK